VEGDLENTRSGWGSKKSKKSVGPRKSKKQVGENPTMWWVSGACGG